jgi:hypothetical protein
MEWTLQNGKQLQHARLSWHIKFENYKPPKPRQQFRITLYEYIIDFTMSITSPGILYLSRTLFSQPSYLCFFNNK